MMNEQCPLQWEECGEVKEISHHNNFTVEYELLPWIWSKGQNVKTNFRSSLKVYQFRRVKIKEKLGWAKENLHRA